MNVKCNKERAMSQAEIGGNDRLLDLSVLSRPKVCLAGRMD